MSDQLEFKGAMDRWIDIKKQLSAVRKDVKVLTDQEKKLRVFIKNFMVDKEITVCNVQEQNAKVNVNKRKVKAPFTKDLVRKGLLKYFRGDESLVDKVFEIIDEEAEVRETESISLRVK